MRFAAMVLVASAVALTGCATKRYGRALAVSPLEARAYDCRELDIEIAKVRALQGQVAEARIDTLSVLGFLGDLGIGNAMERSAAERSAGERLAQLQQAKIAKACPAIG